MTAGGAPAADAARLAFVTGKGGVGRTTVALVLALAAVRRGRRVLLVELDGRADAPRAAGLVPCDDGTPEPLLPGVSWLGVGPDRALAEYLRARLRFAPVADRLAERRALRALVAAAPGLEAMLCVGHVVALASAAGAAHDLVVVDAPATGHALALLGASRTYAAAAGGGPVAAGAREVADVLADTASTRVVLVATAEELAVSEAVTFRHGLPGACGRDADLLVVNRVLPRPLTAGDAALVGHAAGQPAARSALWLHEAAVEQARQLRRARRALSGIPSVTLPFVFRRRIAPDDLAALATRVGPQL